MTGGLGALVAFGCLLSPASLQEVEPPKASEDYYEYHLKYLRSSDHLVDADLRPHFEWPVYLLEEPDYKDAEVPPLPLPLRHRLLVEFLTLACQRGEFDRVPFRTALDLGLLAGGRVARETGDLDFEATAWELAHEHGYGGITQLTGLVALAEIRRMRGRFSASLELLDIATALDQERGSPGEFVAKRVEIANQRIGIYRQLGSFQEAAELEMRNWELACTAIAATPNLTDLEGAWIMSAGERLAIPMGLRFYREVGLTFEEHIASHPAFSRITPGDRARIRLSVANAMVEGRRSQAWPDADPVRYLEEVVIHDLPPSEDQALGARWNLALAWLDQGDTARARAAFERWKAVRSAMGREPDDRERLLGIALEAAIEREAGSSVDTGRLEGAWEQFLARWASTPPEEAGVGFLSFEEWNMIGSELISHYLAGGQIEHALHTVLRAHEQGGLARLLNAEAADRSQVLAQLEDIRRPGEGVAIYSLGRSRCHLFIADDEGLSHVFLGQDFELEGVARKLDRLVENSLVRNSIHRDLTRLLAETQSAFLPAPLLDRVLKWKGIAVVGIDSFGFVPFDLFQLEDRPLGTTHSLRYLPSIPVAEALQARREATRNQPPPGGDLLLIAAPHVGVPPEQRIRYPFDKADQRSLTRPYESVRVLYGPDASREALLATDAAGWRVGHWLVHGEYDPKRPRPSGLRLAGFPDADVMWAREVVDSGLTFPDLSLFTTCSAGRAPLRRGDDGVAHLGSLALLGGASTVVLPRGQIGLAPSSALFSKVHDRVRRGEDPADALRSARSEVYSRSTDLERLHHGAIHLVGLGDEPLFAARPRRVRRGMALALGIGLLLTVGLWMLQRSRSEPD